MTYEVVWAEPAINAAAGFLRDDAPGLAALMDRIDELADEPMPEEARDLGSMSLYRLVTGRYRVLYELDEPTETVTVIHLGRLG